MAPVGSTYEFSGEPVPDQVIIELLEAAMSVPLAARRQYCQFLVVNDRVSFDSIPVFQPHARLLREAPAAILVCGENLPENKYRPWIYDCSFAGDRILYAARQKGLDTVSLAVYPSFELMEMFRSLFGFPKEIMPFSLLGFGYRKEIKPFKAGFDATRVRYNRWE